MDLQKALQQHFHFDSFRPGQEEIVKAALEGRDVLVVMPTGSGKSLCYQLPALMKNGTAVVVSPLIALMKDQVDTLTARSIPATFINSSLSFGEQRNRLEEIEAGRYRLVYIAPERFRQARFVEAMKRVPISFFAIDEAHCVSLWGHDFRPDYLWLGKSIGLLGRPPVAAFTATATPEVRNDILKYLNLNEPRIFVTGFARPNLEFRIFQAAGEAEKYARLSQVIEERGTGIIYCATRKRVEEVASRLREWDLQPISYHGGMDDAERKSGQETFLRKKADIAVATNAFGMGIDRDDIRFVVHFEMPGSVEAYYQEGGRAGRDGAPALCELFFNYADKRIQEFFIEGGNPSKAAIVDLYAQLRRLADGNREIRLSLKEIASGMGRGINLLALSASLTVLNRLHIIERFEIPGQRLRGTRLLQPDLRPPQLKIDQAALLEKAERDKARLQAIIRYGYSHGCRQRWILRFFGERGVSDCGRCDGCRAMDPENFREPTEEEWIILRKALSGVARASLRRTRRGWEGRYGANRIIQMLRGSRSGKIMETNLKTLSTYGLLKGEGTAYLKALFSAMERIGLLTATDDEYRLISLTPSGEKAMRAEMTPKLNWPPRSKRPAEKSVNPLPSALAEADSEEVDPNLFSFLKAKRLELAKARGNLPAYAIFPDKTLRGLAAVKPLSVEEALRLPGIGKIKGKTILPPFLQIIAEYCAGELDPGEKGS